jgi:F0F1-type ATP synthase membrane subunit b/b'
MLRPDSTTSSPEPQRTSEAYRNGAILQEGTTSNGTSYGDASRTRDIDVQRELNKLEEMILDSPRIPLSRRTVIDEEQILDQLDVIRLHLPSAFQEAIEIVQHRDEICMEAEQYAQEVIETAERRALQILDEIGLVRQAELAATQIRQHVQQECEAAQAQTMAEIERLRRQAQQEVEEIRQRMLDECDDIQAGADAYADRVLKDMEQQLGDMIRVIRNGRQQLQPEPPPPTKASESSSARSAPSPRTSERPKK